MNGIISYKRIPKFSKREQLKVLLSALGLGQIGLEEFRRRVQAAGITEADIDVYCQTSVVNQRHAEALNAYRKGGRY